MKKFLQKSLATALVAAMAIAAAAPLSATNAQAAVKDAAVVTTISDSGKITTANGDTADYASNLTFTMRNKDGSYTELSLEDAKAAVKEGKTVKVYTASHKEGYGSAWNPNYTYTDYRTGIQIGEKSEDAIGVEGVGGILKGTVLKGLDLLSTSKNFSAIVVNKSNATIKNPVIVMGNEDGKDNSTGENDINDFVGYGTAVNIYGDTITTQAEVDANGQRGGSTQTNAKYKTYIDLSDGGSITTYGVARPAVAVDNGGDVVIKGDGNDKTTEMAVYGGTLYDGYKNTADTVKMVAPPWVLGIVGNSRGTNMLGQGSTMVVQDANVYASAWGALSTDTGSNPYLYAINSKIDMNLDPSNGVVSGYGTYAIGNAKEYFLGSTFNVPTYLTIAANGDSNHIVLGATKAGETITTKKAVWNDNKMSVVNNGSVKASKTKQTVVNSENFGIDVWGQATVTVKDATVMNTKSAAFLIKSGTSTVNIGANANIKAATDANAAAEKKQNKTKYGVVYQMIDNEDAAAKGISFPEGYMGPVFSDAEFSEAAGYQKAGQTTEAKDAAKNVLNIADKDLKGNIYNGSGYFGKSGYLTVNLKKGSKITGSISSTTIKHTTDGGKTQNTSITEADYSDFGHVMNKPYFNGSNKVTVNVNGTWVADGTSYIQSLKLGTNGSIKGTVTVNGKKVTPKSGKSYTGTIVVKGN